jgi:excinuclease ABC subunit C
VLDELGLHDLPLAGIAKEREELFLPGRSDPIVLPATSQALYLVQRLRDEAHRFAITYHRQVRAKAQTRSALDDLPGVGPARRRALLRVFGSTKVLKGASVDEIAAVPGIGPSMATRIREHLDS